METGKSIAQGLGKLSDQIGGSPSGSPKISWKDKKETRKLIEEASKLIGKGRERNPGGGVVYLPGSNTPSYSPPGSFNSGGKPIRSDNPVRDRKMKELREQINKMDDSIRQTVGPNAGLAMRRRGELLKELEKLERQEIETMRRRQNPPSRRQLQEAGKDRRRTEAGVKDMQAAQKAGASFNDLFAIRSGMAKKELVDRVLNAPGMPKDVADRFRNQWLEASKKFNK